MRAATRGRSAAASRLHGNFSWQGRSPRLCLNLQMRSIQTKARSVVSCPRTFLAHAVDTGGVPSPCKKRQTAQERSNDFCGHTQMRFLAEDPKSYACIWSIQTRSEQSGAAVLSYLLHKLIHSKIFLSACTPYYFIYAELFSSTILELGGWFWIKPSHITQALIDRKEDRDGKISGKRSLDMKHWESWLLYKIGSVYFNQLRRRQLELFRRCCMKPILDETTFCWHRRRVPDTDYDFMIDGSATADAVVPAATVDFAA
jgi:hypothetical protein